MNKIALFPVLLRERFSERTLPREPEPDLVMDDPDQVAAYDKAGSIDGQMASAYLFHSARISQVIQGCKEVGDLAQLNGGATAEINHFLAPLYHLADTSRVE